MSSEVFQLAILLTAKDMASGSLDRAQAKLRAFGKEGEQTIQTMDDLRSEMNKGFSMAGTGIAGLAMFGKGVQVAADFQSSMTDLRSTLAKTAANGKTDLNSLGQDMLKAESIALDLGNKLPGTTEDFVQMITTLKQGGLDTKTIFEGVADSVANLAVANNAIPKDIAGDFAKFVQIYKIKPEDTGKVADVFSRIYTSKGIESGSIIESSKYFQGRAGSALGMTGLQGAEESVRLMAYLQKQGLESSQAGTSGSTFFVQLAKNKKALAEIQKQYGITFDLFDKGGNFKGIDNAVSELEKLKKLNPQQMLVALNKLGGEEGSMAGTAIIQGGVEGWRQFNGEVNQSISLQEKTAMKSADFNNKLEALTGTVKNLVVTGFEPMLGPLTSAAESANDVVGAIQGFAKEHRTITMTATGLFGIGSAALVVVGGFKAMKAAWSLWRLASAVSRSDSLIDFLKSTKVEANGVGASLTGATSKAKGLKGAISRIGNSPIGVTISVMAITGLIELISWEIQQALDARTAQNAASEASNRSYGVYKQAKEAGVQFSGKDMEGQASAAWSTAMSLGLEDTLRSKVMDRPVASLSKKSMLSQAALDTFLFPLNPNKFQGGFFSARQGNVDAYAKGFQKTTPQLAEPAIMTQFLKQLDTRIQNPEERMNVKQGLQQAFPESFAQAMKELSALNFAPLTQSFADMTASQQQAVISLNQQNEATTIFGQNLSNLQQPFSQTQQQVSSLGDSSNRAVSPLRNLANSANSVASSLNSVSSKMSSWQPPTPQVITPTETPTSSIFSFPSRAVGGLVERDGLAMVHAGNVISPAKVSKGLTGKNSAGITVNYSPQITIGGGSTADKKDFQAMLYQHSQDIDRIVSRQMGNGRARA